jgi:hypothetical protein
MRSIVWIALYMVLLGLQAHAQRRQPDSMRAKQEAYNKQVALQKQNDLKTQQETEAYDLLKQAIASGFSYYWVLQNDPAWTVDQKQSANWKKLTEKVKQPEIKE